MYPRIKSVVPVVCLALAAISGCKKEESAPVPKAEQSAPQAQPAAAPAAAPVAAPATAQGEGFSATLPQALAGKSITPGGKANAEVLNKNKINKIADIKSEDGFELHGWAIDDSTKSVPEAVFIELASRKGGDKFYAAASRKERERKDVGSYFKEPAYNKSGFVAKADIKAIPAGEYQVNVIQVVEGKAILATPNARINKTN